MWLTGPGCGVGLRPAATSSPLPAMRSTRRTAAVCALDDDPLFNAGRGAVFTHAGTQEMDAAVMEGRGRHAGRIAGIFGPKNPVLAARVVMELSPHVLLIGEVGTALCREAGLTFAGRDYFFTEARWQALQAALAHGP